MLVLRICKSNAHLSFMPAYSLLHRIFAEKLSPSSVSKYTGTGKNAKLKIIEKETGKFLLAMEVA